VQPQRFDEAQARDFDPSLTEGAVNAPDGTTSSSPSVAVAWSQLLQSPRQVTASFMTAPSRNSARRKSVAKRDRMI
jgi:hypothetical protein